MFLNSIFYNNNDIKEVNLEGQIKDIDLQSNIELVI